MTPGQIAFEAYKDAMSGRTYDDKPIPEWKDLPLIVRAAWQQAAAKVIVTVGIRAQLRQVLDEWGNDTLPRNFRRKG